MSGASRVAACSGMRSRKPLGSCSRRELVDVRRCADGCCGPSAAERLVSPTDPDRSPDCSACRSPVIRLWENTQIRQQHSGARTVFFACIPPLF